ncbi:hypothetical protein [Buttiauxella sp. A111]|nr:hypothetical protein [Buttiauxella sp. A111]GDX07884.1 hypothetical protein BSPA111_41050 [Buttiauxella sp. A111]
MFYWFLASLIVLMSGVWGLLLFNVFDITLHLAYLLDTLEEAMQ